MKFAFAGAVLHAVHGCCNTMHATQDEVQLCAQTMLSIMLNVLPGLQPLEWIDVPTFVAFWNVRLLRSASRSASTATSACSSKGQEGRAPAPASTSGPDGFPLDRRQACLPCAAGRESRVCQVTLQVCLSVPEGLPCQIAIVVCMSSCMLSEAICSSIRVPCLSQHSVGLPK